MAPNDDSSMAVTGRLRMRRDLSSGGAGCNAFTSSKSGARGRLARHVLLLAWVTSTDLCDMRADTGCDNRQQPAQQLACVESDH